MSWIFKGPATRAAELVLLAALVLTAGPARPQEADPHNDAIVRSGLAVPRFVSLRSDDVNVRTGPGLRYPIEWVFVRSGLPVEITAEFDTWRRIRDVDGTQGWVHKSTLSSRRTAVITHQTHALRRDPSATAEAIAQLEPGVIVRLRRCKGDWCEVDKDSYRGWLARDDFWGTEPNEAVGE